MTRFHPYATIFPLMQGDGFEALKADIKAKGICDKLMLHQGMLLDGRNRERAAEALGWKLPPDCYETFKGDDALEWVISKNLQRRHLNESQRAMVAARLSTMRQGERTDLQPSANLQAIPHQKSNARRVSQPEAAKVLNVSTRSLGSAKVVLARAVPELQRAVDDGQLAVSQAAQASSLAPDVQREIAETAKAGKANVVRTVIKKRTRARRERDLGAKIVALPDQKFGLVLADPEWQFEPYSFETGMDRAATNHYPTSDIATIEARDVEQIAAADCVLALWTTDLGRGIDTLRAWGFAFKSYFVWVKDVVELELTPEQKRTGLGDGRYLMVIGAPGTGYWNTDRDELLLIGTRGKPVCPAPGEQGESVWFAARGVHSEKPDISYVWFERHFPNTPKIELNARRARPGWERWGNEAPAPVTVDIVMPELPAGQLRWLKQPGDAIAAGDVVAEVESTDVIGEIAASDAGILAAHVVKSGLSPSPGAVIATLHRSESGNPAGGEPAQQET